MEATPTFLDFSEIMDALKQVDGVICVDSLRLWSLSINKIALSAHLTIGYQISFRLLILILNNYNNTRFFEYHF